MRSPGYGEPPSRGEWNRVALVLLLVAFFGWYHESDLSRAAGDRLQAGVMAVVSALGYGTVWFRLVRRAGSRVLQVLFVLVGLAWCLPFALRAIWPHHALRLPLYVMVLLGLGTVALGVWAARAAKDLADREHSGLPD